MDNSICEEIITSLKKSLLSVKAFEEFFINSIEVFLEKSEKFKKDYEIGIEIDDKLLPYASDNARIAQEKIENLQLSNKRKINDYLDINISDKEGIRYSIVDKEVKNKEYVDPMIARFHKIKYSEYNKCMENAALNSLIVLFEDFLSDTYRLLVMHSPEKYFKSKQINLFDVIKAKDINDVINNQIDIEVENKMFDAVKSLKEICSIEGINKNENLVLDYEELNARRNVCIHNRGMVNDKYLAVINNKNIRRGDFLETNLKYFEDAINLIYKIELSLVFELCVKFDDEKDTFDWDNELSAIIFDDLLCDKKYNVCKHIYKIMSKCKNFDFENRTMYRINYINSCKQLNEKEEVEKELSNLDLSIAKKEFEIAKLCLQDKNKEAYDKIKEDYPKPYNAETIRDWPIFIDFRKSEYYSKLQEEYKSDFEIKTYEKTSINLIC